MITKTFVGRGINEVITFFCDMLRNLTPLLVGTEVLKDHLYQKYIISLDE